MTLENAIRRAFTKAVARNWKKIYFAFDIHETILHPTWKKDKFPHEFYPYAKDVCQYLTSRNDICSILWTCSYEDEIERYVKFFEGHGIYFDYVNKNPEVLDDIGCYRDKLYMNVILDDKSGFDWETDWLTINSIMRYEFPEGYLDDPSRFITPPQWRDIKSFEVETVQKEKAKIDPHSKFSDATHAHVQKCQDHAKNPSASSNYSHTSSESESEYVT